MTIYIKIPSLKFHQPEDRLGSSVLIHTLYRVSSFLRNQSMRLHKVIPNTAVFGPTKLIGTIPSTMRMRMRMRMKILDEDFG